MIDDNTNTVIGGDSELEKMFDAFLLRMQTFERKTSLQTQRSILRAAVKPAVLSLRRATRTAWPKRTGRAWRSVRTAAKNSKTRPGLAFATYGWSNKGIKPIYTNRRKKGAGGGYRQRPKPATYIGIWGDLGTQRQGAKGIFKTQWASQKPQIIKRLEGAITDIMREAKISN